MCVSGRAYVKLRLRNRQKKTKVAGEKKRKSMKQSKMNKKIE